jgi:cytochrome c oxidase subunit 2
MKYAIFALALLALVASACTNTAATPAGKTTTPSGEFKEFNVVAYQYGFEPSTITVKKGDRVKITFTSRDAGHGVFIPDFEVATPAFGKGQSQTIEFVADKSGTFEYLCSVYCGSGHPTMKGTIIVQ